MKYELGEKSVITFVGQSTKTLKKYQKCVIKRKHQFESYANCYRSNSTLE